MNIYMVKRIWENGETEWGRTYNRSKNGRGKWTREFNKATKWDHKNGPIQFLRCVRDDHKHNKTQDNCEYKIVEFDLVERI